jgi:predicted transcriptional regulator of viral defense system
MSDLTRIPLEKWTSMEIDAAVIRIVSQLGRATTDEILEGLHTIAKGYARMDAALSRLVARGELIRLARGLYAICDRSHNLPKPTHQVPSGIN